MLRTLEATIDRDGTVRLAEPITLVGPSRALVTILPASFDPAANEAFIMAESALAEGWSGPAEDEAWKGLADWPAIDDEEDQ